MKRTMMLLGIVAVVGVVVGTALSADEAKPATLKGTVVKVMADAAKVVVKGRGQGSHGLPRTPRRPSRSTARRPSWRT